MDYKQNLHTHSTYCDGKNTPREMIEKAIKMGFNSIGFSGHSYAPHSIDYCMSLEGTEAYIKEISALREEYAPKIEVFCGIEYDMYSDMDINRFDYSIGSLHYLKINGKYVDFDRSADEVKSIIDIHFDGDGMAYANQYFKEFSQLPKYGNFDIIGHFDLITKHIDNRNFFDYNSKEYLSYAFDCAKALQGKIPYFEVNTGAIARGYRTTPYPSVPIIKELKRLGFGVVITSDCHDGDKLDCKFRMAEKLLTECGFKERFVLTKNGFVPIRL